MLMLLQPMSSMAGSSCASGSRRGLCLTKITGQENTIHWFPQETDSLRESELSDKCLELDPDTGE